MLVTDLAELAVKFSQFLGLIIGAYTLYNLWVIWPMIFKYKQERGSDTPYHRFAVLICAHNEEKVLAKSIASIQKMDYPKDMYDVFVVADNCTDRTAEVARSMGCIVWGRTDEKRKSKGYAMQDFFRRFFRSYESEYDSCLVLDADGVVSGDFLSSMNRMRNTGAKILVGYRIGMNPEASAIAGCNSLFWLMQRRMFDHPRAVAGRSCLTVGGNGFVFDLALIRKSGWNTHTLTEDNEFSLNMILQGEKIIYNREAVIYDEQPTSLRDTYRQRTRWAYGTKQLFKEKPLQLFHRVMLGYTEVLDASVYSLGFLFALLIPINSLIRLLAESVLHESLSFLLFQAVKGTLVAYAGTLILMLLIVFLEKRYWKGQWKAILLSPFYLMVIAVVTNFKAAFTPNPTWVPMIHTDSTDIEVVEKRVHSVR